MIQQLQQSNDTIDVGTVRFNIAEHFWRSRSIFSFLLLQQVEQYFVETVFNSLSSEFLLCLFCFNSFHRPA